MKGWSSLLKQIKGGFDILTKRSASSVSVVEFYKTVIRDPIGARSDPTLLMQYQALRSLDKSPALTDLERILLEELKPSFAIFSNEVPHQFIESLRLNAILFKPPAHFLLNPQRLQSRWSDSFWKGSY